MITIERLLHLVQKELVLTSYGKTGGTYVMHDPYRIISLTARP